MYSFAIVYFYSKSLEGTHLSQIVLTVDQSVLTKMYTYYKSHFFEPFPAGSIFRAKTTHAVITAYKSGKVLFQGKSPDSEASIWQTTPQKQTKGNSSKISKPGHTDALPINFLDSNHIGSDETGTGDYFGPITVCAAFVTHEQIALLKELGVEDSKNLTDVKIKAITKDLLHVGIPYSLLTLPNDRYNQLQKQGWSQGKMKVMLHHHTHQHLLKKINPDTSKGILVDQFCQPYIYDRHLHSEHESRLPNTYFLTKAESYSTAVAAASLIARTRFVREIDELSESVGIELLKGASAKVDQTIAKVIKKYGKTKLEQIAKVHFANTDKAQKYL